MTGTIPIVQLKGGEFITPRFVINEARVRHWKYAGECDPLFGGSYLPGAARFRVVEISRKPGAMWVRVEMPGRSPPAYLKISGEEYASAFQMVR